jgi:hypothetical protein
VHQHLGYFAAITPLVNSAARPLVWRFGPLAALLRLVGMSPLRCRALPAARLASPSGAPNCRFKVDFGTLPPGHEASVKIEKSESSGDAIVRRIRELVLMACAVASAAVFLWICYQTVTSPTAGAEEKRWATSIITAVVGGLVGALVKK